MSKLTTSVGTRGESATAKSKSGNRHGNRVGASRSTGQKATRTPKHK